MQAPTVVESRNETRVLKTDELLSAPFIKTTNTTFKIQFLSLNMKNALLFMGLLTFLPLVLYSQDLNIQRSIIEHDKFFCRHKIPDQFRKKYRNITQYLQTIIPSVFAEIRKTEPNFFYQIDSFSIVLSYNPNATAEFGMIWKSKDSVYFYNYNWGSTVKIEKLSRKSLDSIDRQIIDSFEFADSRFFSHIDADMFTPLDGSYHIANKCRISNNLEILTLAFYE